MNPRETTKLKTLEEAYPLDAKDMSQLQDILDWLDAAEVPATCSGSLEPSLTAQQNDSLNRSNHTIGPPSTYSHLTKTKLCFHYSIGRCSRGQRCAFAHSMSELREQPNLHKTRLCINYERNSSCSKGNHCRFAHGLNELRNASTKSRYSSFCSREYSKFIGKLYKQKYQHRQDSNSFSMKQFNALDHPLSCYNDDWPIPELRYEDYKLADKNTDYLTPSFMKKYSGFAAAASVNSTKSKPIQVEDYDEFKSEQDLMECLEQSYLKELSDSDNQLDMSSNVTLHHDPLQIKLNKLVISSDEQNTSLCSPQSENNTFQNCLLDRSGRDGFFSPTSSSCTSSRSLSHRDHIGWNELDGIPRTNKHYDQHSPSSLCVFNESRYTFNPSSSNQQQN